MATPTQVTLTLQEALRQWCRRDLVDAVMAGERRLSRYDAFYFDSRGRLTPLRDLPEEPVVDPMEGGTYRMLDVAWSELKDEFIRHVTRGELLLSGVQMMPELQTERVQIPSAWVSAATIYYAEGKLVVQKRVFVAVAASRPDLGDASAPVLEGASAAALTLRVAAPITSETVRDLSDDEVLIVLNEYARRVVGVEGSKLELPVKVSFMPILRRKMEHRFKTGEICGTLAAEAKALAAWIETKVCGHQTPKPGSIENQLRDDYRRLKP